MIVFTTICSKHDATVVHVVFYSYHALLVTVENENRGESSPSNTTDGDYFLSPKLLHIIVERK
jgi:hypothetical protein